MFYSWIVVILVGYFDIGDDSFLFILFLFYNMFYFNVVWPTWNWSLQVVVRYHKIFGLVLQIDHQIEHFAPSGKRPIAEKMFTAATTPEYAQISPKITLTNFRPRFWPTHHHLIFCFRFSFTRIEAPEWLKMMVVFEMTEMVEAAGCGWDKGRWVVVEV